MMQPHNWTALLIAAVAAWLFGAIYYTLLGPKWIAAQGLTVEQHKAANASISKVAFFTPFVLSFIAEVLMAATLSGIMVHSAFSTARQGAIAGALCWFGFVLTTVVVNNAYAMRKPMLGVIDAVHWLFVLIIIGAVVGWLS